LLLSIARPTHEVALALDQFQPLLPQRPIEDGDDLGDAVLGTLRADEGKAADGYRGADVRLAGLPRQQRSFRELLERVGQAAEEEQNAELLEALDQLTEDDLLEYAQHLAEESGTDLDEAIEELHRRPEEDPAGTVAQINEHLHSDEEVGEAK
jgi:hypothetical protein